ncbi:MAG: imidazole glycerol phosphate synthase subunit HisH [Rhodanobacteraceae bacterium]|nr:imidazole glycerol phosphate synthase subunit HisH [Rhodanobacteraceae bacterium]
MSAVVVVDSGVANIGSVVAALERAQAQVSVSRDWEVIRRAPRVLLPGVGAAAAAMRELDRLGLSERLPTLTQPVLGVCLGMQLLFEGSEEGAEHRDPGPGTRDPATAASRDLPPAGGHQESAAENSDTGCACSSGSRVPGPGSRLHDAVPCLGILPGTVRRLPESPGVRIPHMGWNALLPRRVHPLVEGLSERDYAYFVHSFAVAESELTLMACQHGGTFSAIVARSNFMGAQFHPERSAAVGARLLRNFLTLEAEALR